MEPNLARYIWQLIEPYHAVVYFAPTAKETFQQAGFKGGWMGYFAGRAGVMGAVGAEVVAATFYNFNPKMVARSIPDAWSFSTPAKALEARLAVADEALRAVLGDRIEVGDAPELLGRVVAAGSPAGRPLFAANAAQERPAVPHLDLWWSCTALREHRGDGHVACLTQADIDGCEAHLLSVAVGAVEASTLEAFRGWTQADLDAAAERLRTRGLVDAAGMLTEQGTSLKQRIESDTDRLAAQPFSVLSDAEVARLVQTLERLAQPLVELLMYPNPMGLTRPARP